MKIRRETPEDHQQIYALVKAAFAGAQHADGNEQDLVCALRQDDAYIPELSLVAEKDGRIVGHIMFTAAHIGETPVLALAPLSVLPEFQGQGVGSALIREGHRIAKGLGYGYCVVLGSETYYPRMGYVPADRYGIAPPFDVPRQNFMAYRIMEDAPDVQGVLRYAKAFGL